jgi:hypothetical protein
LWEPSLETAMHRFYVCKPTAIWKITWWNQNTTGNISGLHSHGLPIQYAVTDLVGSGLVVLSFMALLLVRAWRSAQVWYALSYSWETWQKILFVKELRQNFPPTIPFSNDGCVLYLCYQKERC